MTVEQPPSPAPTPTPTILIAPTEPIALRAIGKTSSLPEKYGADVAWIATRPAPDRKKVLVGVQRKEWKDLIASVEDGRWAREMQMLQSCGMAFVVVEGWPVTGPSGQVVDKAFGRPWNIDALRSVLWSCMSHGIHVDRTANVKDTVRWVQRMVDWSGKGEHSSLRGRPGPGSMWGKPTNREYGLHLLQGLPGVGPTLAGELWDAFGKVPWKWEVGVEDLTKVKGVGRVRAQRMIDALETRDGNGWG
jgi:ERCC4-type nuclease